MTNTVNTVKDGPGLFAKGIAQTLKDNLNFCSFVDKADESEFDGKNGFKSGDTIYTSIPQRKIVQEDNLDITSLGKDVVEEKAPLVLDKSATTADQFDSLELATDVDVANALKRFGIPAAESLAQKIESRCFGIAQDATYNFSGTAGSNSFAPSDILDAGTLLDESLAPMKDRGLFMTSRTGALAIDARKGLFNSAEAIGSQYKTGSMSGGEVDGFTWYQSQLVGTHTNGTDTSPAAVNDASVAEATSTLAIDALSASATVTKGTVFTIVGVNKVHPITKDDTGILQQFVVTALGTANGSGEVTLTISPSIYAGSAGLQNVTALPADNAIVTFKTGTASTGYAQNLALHKSAFKMVTVPLYTPKGEDLVASETVDGITVNIVRFFDGNTRKVTTRYDVLYGFAPVRQEWSTRITV